MSRNAAYWIDKLGLQKHPEGGFFKETYRAAESVAGEALPSRFGGARSFSTAITFLLAGRDVSVLHRLKSDEIWHFYDGATLGLHIIHSDGRYGLIRLGDGGVFQAVAPAGCWFGAVVEDADAYALVGCTVAPGFDFADFELGRRDWLLDQYPRYREIIERLTKE